MLVERMRRESESGQPSSKESFSKANAQLDRLSGLATALTEGRSIGPATPAFDGGRLSETGSKKAAEATSEPGPGVPRESAGKILIVDDDPSILEALGDLLRDRYEVVVAGNGEEAVDRLASGPVDLVVLDMVMPLLDGEGALREIRGRGLRVPVIVASARGDRLANYRELGADDFIQKPFEIGTLERKIDRLLTAAC